MLALESVISSKSDDFLELLKLVGFSTNEDLRGADLSATDLRHQCLANADLRGIDFSEADLSWSKLLRSDISGGEFYKSNLNYAVLLECVLEACSFEQSCLKGANFRSALCNYVKFSECDLSNCSFFSADLTGVRFVDCNLSKVDFRCSNFEYKMLQNSSVKGAMFGFNSAISPELKDQMKKNGAVFWEDFPEALLPQDNKRKGSKKVRAFLDIDKGSSGQSS